MTKRKMVGPSRDYEVGYGKPPKHTRFRKGQPSPNPRGRGAKKTKEAEDLRKIFERIMGEPVTVRSGEKVMTMTAWEGIMRKLRNKAFEGDYRASYELRRLGRELGCLDPVREESIRGGVLVIPRSVSDEDWERRANEHQAPYRGNVGLVASDDCSEKDLNKQSGVAPLNDSP